MKPKVIFITGPTGAGKSELAVQLALKINGEVINADSRQVYRGLDVGAAKISRAEMQGVPHHLLSVASSKRDFSLARWLVLADRAVKVITRRGRVPIFCGGTLLYLRALSEGWVLPSVKPNAKLRRELEHYSLSELQRRLQHLDSERAKTVELQNRRRLIRAIEIATVLGKVPSLRREPCYEVLIVAPRIAMTTLERRLAQRVQRRVPRIVAEIRRLRSTGLSCRRIVNFGLEYDWFGRVVCNGLSRQEAVAGCIQESIRFAKKQRSSLERLSGVHWIRNRSEAMDYTQRFLAL